MTVRSLLRHLASHNEQYDDRYWTPLPFHIPPFREAFDVVRTRCERTVKGSTNKIVMISFRAPRVLLVLPRWIGQDTTRTFWSIATVLRCYQPAHCKKQLRDFAVGAGPKRRK